VLDKINNSYFQLYAATIVGSSLLDLGCRFYSYKTHKHDNQAKIGLAISRTLQNTSFVMPIIWIGYNFWKSNVNVVHSGTKNVLAAAAFALTVGYPSYVILEIGLNPVFALGAPRFPKDLTAYFTNSICNVFRVLNITAIYVSLSSGKISLPSALIAISACLVTMVAQGHLFELR
jgi:hypothetical protein